MQLTGSADGDVGPVVSAVGAFDDAGDRVTGEHPAGVDGVFVGGVHADEHVVPGLRPGEVRGVGQRGPVVSAIGGLVEAEQIAAIGVHHGRVERVRI